MEAGRRLGRGVSPDGLQAFLVQAWTDNMPGASAVAARLSSLHLIDSASLLSASVLPLPLHCAARGSSERAVGQPFDAWP